MRPKDQEAKKERPKDQEAKKERPKDQEAKIIGQNGTSNIPNTMPQAKKHVHPFQKLVID